MKKRIRLALFAAALLLRMVLPSAAAFEALIPVGDAVGLELETDGVYVLKFDGDHTPAELSGLKAGDRILQVNGEPLDRADGLRAAAAGSGGSGIVLRVDRGGKEMSFTLFPERGPAGWQLGLFLQDRVSGLGTVTFYDPESGLFGALGHGVNEAGGARAMAIRGGTASDAAVTEVQRGAAGTPGCLKGCAGQRGLLGTVEKNTPVGIFGHAVGGGWDGEPLPVAARREITTGPAEIWSNVSGAGIDHFTVTVEEILFDGQSGRNLKLRVTDPRLLEQTGGIVQGMSGSPIIQNGKLIGAVTHVLVQDPVRGYGIFLENMLAACEPMAA